MGTTPNKGLRYPEGSALANTIHLRIRELAEDVDNLSILPAYEQTFSFPVASALWTINHDQNANTIEVETFDSGGNPIMGDVTHPDENTISVTWYFPTSGTALVHS